MSDHESSQQPLGLIDIKNAEPQPLPLPQYELVDDCEIGNFLRDRPDDLDNALHFSNPDQNINNDDFNYYPRSQQKNTQHQSYQSQPQQHQRLYSNRVNYQTLDQSHYNNHQQALSIEHPQQKSKAIRKCICKKTQCLKMYCECFASNLPCTQQCACIECKNTDKHQKQIIQAKQMIQEKGIVGLHSCSLSEKRCNCKKSNCLKKYCQCYNSGVKCSQACKCQSCKNCENKNNNEDENQNEKITNAPKIGKAKKQRKNAKVELKN